jgi:hypothetical protein
MTTVPDRNALDGTVAVDLSEAKTRKGAIENAIREEKWP